jgi:hypothetical protein
MQQLLDTVIVVQRHRLRPQKLHQEFADPATNLRLDHKHLLGALNIAVAFEALYGASGRSRLHSHGLQFQVHPESEMPALGI